MTPSTPSGLLTEAVRRDPARPLLTFYDDATGERTELSVATFANWVAKTANLLRDDLDAQPGARVALGLPVHWQSAVWLQACWELRLVVDLTGRRADLAVVTHEATTADADEVVSLGLGPMGLARPGSAPTVPGALDYDREVHGHGDRFAATTPAAPDDPVLVTSDGTVTAAVLSAAATQDTLPPGSRLLVTEPLTSAAATLATLLVPLASDVTAVLCRHLDPGRLTARVAQENLVAAYGDTAGVLPEWHAQGWA